MEQEIEKYRHDLEVVRDTANQVIKDFDIAGIEIGFSGDTSNAYAELKKQLFPALENLYKKNSTAFMALLYRIDIEERAVVKIKTETGGTGFFMQLAELILEREFNKVLTRKLYKTYTATKKS
jgi:hypothetical protein